MSLIPAAEAVGTGDDRRLSKHQQANNDRVEDRRL